MTKHTYERVLKYPIPLDDEWHEIPKPCGPNWQPPYFHIGIQDGVVMVWMAQPEPMWEDWPTSQLKVVGTGHIYHATDLYIGSVQDPRGFVWHVIAKDQG